MRRQTSFDHARASMALQMAQPMPQRIVPRMHVQSSWLSLATFQPSFHLNHSTSYKPKMNCGQLSPQSFSWKMHIAWKGLSQLECKIGTNLIPLSKQILHAIICCAIRLASDNTEGEMTQSLTSRSSEYNEEDNVKKTKIHFHNIYIRCMASYFSN